MRTAERLNQGELRVRPRPRERAAFISAYTKILTQAWSDDAYARRLETDPRALLAAEGLRVPAEAEIQIMRATDAEPDLEKQVGLWFESAGTGVCVLYVPHVPHVESKELSEADLEAVAGGDVNACSCCSPCCTCG